MDSKEKASNEAASNEIVSNEAVSNNSGFAQIISNKIELGHYRHYKGGEYQVIDTVTHSETMETMVLYSPLYLDDNGNEQGLWVRPISMFKEAVEIDGKIVPRFELITSDS